MDAEIESFCAVPSPNFIVRVIEYIMSLFRVIRPYEEECYYRLETDALGSIVGMADVDRKIYKFIITEAGEIKFEDENAPVDLSKCWTNYETGTFCICWKGYSNWLNTTCCRKHRCRRR